MTPRLRSTGGAVTRSTGELNADVVVVGTGAAGLAAALRLAEANLDTLLVCKGSLGGGSTAWAQGGLAAVLDEDDTIQLHVEDTLTAGAGLCDTEAVRELAAAAPAVISRLVALGAAFDTDATGAIALGLEGGHRRRRIVHAGGDASGAEVSRVLCLAVAREIERGRIRLLEHTVVADAVRDRSGAVCGVTALGRDGLLRVTSRAVVLATGGIGQVWATTTNPGSATGDGLALALRAGAVVRDVEFMQFHPTILVVPPDRRQAGDRGVLVSEAVRGEGAVLRDLRGDRVMTRVHPMADLAPRDVVSAAMQTAMLASGDTHLLLDATGFGAAMWEHHFPTILQLCRERGVDPVTEPIPVRPAAHYHCGGVAADLDGRTSLPGLYAVGEVAATGVQGANRLASNSITEALVAGDRVGVLLAHDLPARRVPLLDTPAPSVAVSLLGNGSELGAAMDSGAGVLRNTAGLAGVAAELDRTSGAAVTLSAESIQQANRRLVAEAVVTAAITRTESRGCHRRSDHPRTDPAWQVHQSWVLADGELRTAEAFGREDVA